MHYPTTDIQTEFKINWPIKNKINATMKYFPYATDGRTEGRTDMSDNNPYVFFRKKNTKNTDMNSVCQLLQRMNFKVSPSNIPFK